ncbi:TPA: hypothetical protein DCZ39_00880 [Patescibacteria group bacterium]|nr:hypothetical protein [Candidatus Gracilibacteria bacterium]
MPFQNFRDISFSYKRFKDIILMILLFLASFIKDIIQAMRKYTMRKIVDQSSDLFFQRSSILLE